MKPTHVLVVGASGSIGRHAVEKARAAGYRVRALVRDRHASISAAGSKWSKAT